MVHLPIWDRLDRYEPELVRITLPFNDHTEGTHNATGTRDMVYYNNAISKHHPFFEVNKLIKITKCEVIENKCYKTFKKITHKSQCLCRMITESSLKFK